MVEVSRTHEVSVATQGVLYQCVHPRTMEVTIRITFVLYH